MTNPRVSFRMEDATRKNHACKTQTLSIISQFSDLKIESETEKENELDRAQWGNSMQFLMSCISFSVGLGNVWRFPNTAYANGGGAFLIPYIIVSFTVGKPFYYMEMMLGQFASRSCIKIWSVSPAFRGIGYGVTVATFAVSTYYAVLIALTVYYFISSFQSPLPWSMCRPEWGELCFDSTSTYQNTTSDVTRLSSTELFFIKEVLNEISINEGLGIPSWKLILCLFLSWSVIFGVVSKGVKSSGKFAYFLAIFPYGIMITLLIKAVTLEGALDGIAYLYRPDWNRILEPAVWYAAVTQCFFSLGVCSGPIIMYSSYNDFRHDAARDCIIVTSLDLFTSLLAGTTIFGILGNLAHQVGSDDFSSIVRSGTGIAFISYPEALAKFAFLPQLFSVLFFLMLFVLGIGSCIAIASVVISVVKDQFHSVSHWKIALTVCLSGFSVGIIYCVQSGQYLLNLIDYYAGTFIIMVLSVFQVIAIAYIYGVENFSSDIEFMTGVRPSFYWRICWRYLTPSMLLVIFGYFLTTMTPIKYNDEFYPSTVYAIGWALVAVAIIPIPVLALKEVIKNKNTSFLHIFKPNENWGPCNPDICKNWKAFKESKACDKLNIQGNLKI